MDAIEELLTRGVDKIYPSKGELEKVLRSGKKLKLYQGFDPTGTQLHIGHMIGLRKLAQWQALGHHVIFLIGDGTGQAGDPSGKLTARDRFLTNKELRENAKSYVKQAEKIVKFDGKNPVEILYNGDWLNELKLAEILNIAENFSLQQLEERDLFEQRKKQGQTINFREFMYPLLQGYDSVAMGVDLEIGGSDQTFNMLAGRTLVKAMQNRDKFVMTTPLLTDSQGRKIGKTEGNVIALTDKPNDLYGKIMQLGDDVIEKAFEYLTDVPMEEFNKGDDPMNQKKKLAFEIVKQLNSNEDAKSAQEYFEKTVQNQEVPADIPVYQYTGRRDINIVDLLIETKLATSKSEARRLIEQGGVEVDGEKIQSEKLKVKNNMIIKVGKRKYLKLVASS